MRGKMVPRLLSSGSHSTSSGLTLNQPAAWSVLENYFKGDVLLLFNIFLITSANIIFMCSQLSNMTSLGARPN